MSFYEERILPHVIGLACSTRPVQKQRQKIVPLAKGRVLEIGFGSGLNLPFYDSGKVEKIWALEPSEGMRAKAKRQVDASALDIEFIDLPGEEIPLAADSADTVLVTYSLCTIPDVVLALEGMRRVLKPGGRLLFCEHGKAPDENILRWQNRLNPAWQKIAGGCQLNRDIPSLLATAGFRMESDERMYIPGLKILSYNYWGIAVSGGTRS
ncbi:MAG: class I SAM-dependent methyltransferase [Gammaproteobacteria bacterium]|nr:class I SAM-dependent methyltransferase [Gammaproteobacteria bacterium]